MPISRYTLARTATVALLVGAAVLFTACNGSPGPAPRLDALSVEPVVSGLAAPVALAAPAGDARLFVVEQAGRIRIVRNGALLPTPFLDIQSLVLDGGERGLLGLAFHPRYATNGFFFVYYTDASGNIRIDRFHVSANPDVADAASGTLVLGIPHPGYSNHNGGMLAFGLDGKLYAGTGDGGGAGDPNGNAQSKGSLLGKVLRLDVDAGSPYAIPPDNPFVGQTGARGEIWAYGLRNPWRFAFDHAAGHLYIADVGQGAWEEVNVALHTRGGVNYGWDLMEGNHCYGGAACTGLPLERPAHEYSHDDGCSITGGYVYRGSAIPGARGLYFFSDYCAGFLRTFRYENGQAADVREWTVGPLGNVTSFGEGSDGELYIMSSAGTLFRIAGQ